MEEVRDLVWEEAPPWLQGDRTKEKPFVPIGTETTVPWWERLVSAIVTR